MHGSVDASDARLVGQVAAGDRQAFERLYRGYFPRLTRFLNGMTRSVPLIEEIVNDTMLVVWQKAHSYDGSCKVSTWIFAIAYRKACKAIKGLDDPVDTDPDQFEGDICFDPVHELDQHRLQRAIGAALEDLPPAQRAVVQLTYHHDMGYADIAAVMDCPVNTVKTRMFHARRRLRKLLADQLEEGS
ncbi:sigma-70 family RNA polymerase sigma factor [Massilia sp. R2A-15]|uniref:RNA polymerase sigma factor n=1 Tax=Massilia sp. R2A-15 TaxID=3064278 RepID=UPI002734C924|nr:sigma-70 family RNA polymerase sigma factor [Massilia sp. R2A-15]WLI90600.1 sigma-70 family RNA polymerase sigma factor [Massilia sp. R2A-15]